MFRLDLQNYLNCSILFSCFEFPFLTPPLNILSTWLESIYLIAFPNLNIKYPLIYLDWLILGPYFFINLKKYIKKYTTPSSK